MKKKKKNKYFKNTNDVDVLSVIEETVDPINEEVSAYNLDDMTRGGGSTSGKYIYLNSSLESKGLNKYRLNTQVTTSSSGVYNGYGIRMYATIDGSRVLVGTITISGGSPSTSLVYHDFTISKTCQVYASCICSYCEDGSHNEDRDKFINQTSPDTAYYTDPNTAPSTPTITVDNVISGGHYRPERTLNLSLSACTDPDGDTVSYSIRGQRSINGGPWQDWNGPGSGEISASQSVEVDISGDERGTRYQVWGHSFANTQLSGQSNIINNIYRNNAPSRPIISCTNTEVINNRIIVENSISLDVRGSIDEELHTIVYHMYGQYQLPSGGSWIPLADFGYLGVGSTKTIDITSHPRGSRYQFWGVAEDSLGAWSEDSKYVDNVYKNQVPNSISIINPLAGIIVGNTIDLSWISPGDPDSQPLTYNISVSKNNADYQNIVSRHTQTSYSYNISADPKGTIYIFKISANDGIMNGAETTSPRYRKDFMSVSINPINNSTLFQLNPRFIMSKISNSDIYLCVNCNGTVYNSKDNSSMFSTSNTLLNGEICYVFRAQNIRIGSNTIIIYNSDGVLNSSSITRTINIENLDNNIVTQSISKSTFDIIKDKTNILRAAYGLSIFSYESITKNSSIIKYDNMIKIIREQLTGISDSINVYDSKDINYNWDSISKGSVIKKTNVQQILDSIRNI